MSRWSKEAKEIIKDRARLILIRNPRISTYKLALELNISEPACYYIKKDILNDSREELAKATVEDELIKFQEETDALCKEAWDIILKDTREVKKPVIGDDGNQKKDDEGNLLYYVDKVLISITSKTRAMALIGKLRNTLLDAKFNAGLYKKDWGNLGEGLFDEKYNKINEALEAIRSLKTVKNNDNGIQNREGGNVEAESSTINGVRKDSSEAIS
jgi:hypothetical protein